MQYPQLESYMRIVHELLFEQLCDIDRVCREYSIEYSLIAGTLLGAVRYKDFIPWDDDADIVMTRENFELFNKAYGKEKSPNLWFSYDGQWLKRVGHKKRIEYKGHFLDRICTDIFIFDSTPANALAHKSKVLVLKILQGMIKDKPDYGSYSIAGKIATGLAQTMGKPFSTDTKLSMYDAVSKLGNNKKTNEVWYYNAAFSSLGSSIEKSLISEYKDIVLRGRSFRVFDGYEAYLQVAYGPNYLTPPPVDQQLPQHVPFFKNLNRTVRSTDMEG